MLGVQPNSMQMNPNFSVGAGTSNRIVQIALAVIAAAGAFFLLPFESAAILTLGFGALASLFSCSDSSNQTWRFLSLPRGLFAAQPAVRVVQPPIPVVAQPGPRIIPGQDRRAIHPNPVQLRREARGPNVPVGRG